MKKCARCGYEAEQGDYCANCGSVLVEITALEVKSGLKIRMGHNHKELPRSYSEPDNGKYSEPASSGSRLKGALGGVKIAPDHHAIGTDSTPTYKTTAHRKNGELASAKRIDSRRSEPELYYHVDEEGRVQFKRAPRLIQELPEGVIEISSPPSAMGKPEINWLSTFLPIVITIGIAVIMATVMGNPMMMLYTLPMTFGGVVVSITNYRKQTKKYYDQIDLRKEKYEQHLKEITSRIEEKRQEQMEAMLLSDPSTEDCVAIVEKRQARLWERRPTDEDFLHVRVGSGKTDFSVKITIPKESLSLEDDELKAKPKEIYEGYRSIDSAPIICNIFDEQVCGIVGRPQDNRAVIKNIIVQLTTHHCYSELKAVCIYDPSDENEMKWIKDLPHFCDNSKTSFLTACSKSEATELLKKLSDILKQRKLTADAEDSYGKAPVYLPYFLFIVLQPAFLEKSHPINEFLFRNRNLGAGVIMAVEDLAQLPKECNELMLMKGTVGELFNKNSASAKRRFTIDPVNRSSYETFGRSMKPIYCEEGVLRDTLPKSYTFYELLGISDVTEYDIGEHWRTSNITASLAAPLGITESGEVLSLDLHENAHGPHGLVAGTTGSGKSELLQSYVLSMALNYHPYEVGFVIIDFKGGGMANQLAKLPHLIGAITNIEGGEISRSLASIKAELIKRQKYFAEISVNSIDKYIEKYKRHEVDTPLPHLIIIVDEFAQLKAEQPEFMSELISTARIGRSLGVHLILATQKPAGQVNEQIWSNVSFEICLKVASETDSKEVIKSGLAARIVEPGRAYLRVGNNEVFELIQSGYSGALTGRTDTTQLDQTVELIAAYCNAQHIEKLSDICLPALEDKIPYPQLPYKGQLPIGVYDDPNQQYQGVFQIDFTEKNTFIVGSSMSGKTNLLQCFIRGIADSYSPDEINIYILDFASMVLKCFEGLRHVGGVVTAFEDEKLKNLIKLLNAEIDSRRRRFMNLGVGSYSAYYEAGRRDIPRIIIVVDNLTAIREMYFQDDDPLLTICQIGLTYGISVIVANNQTAGIGYKYLTSFANRIALFCNDSTEYSTLFDTHCALRIPDIPGRCIVDIEKSLYACQVYLAFSGAKEIDRAESINKYVLNTASRYTGQAKMIPMIPEKINERDVFKNYKEALTEKGRIIIGLDYANVQPVTIDLPSVGVLAIAGSRKKQIASFLRYMIGCCDKAYHDQTEFFIIDSVSRTLADCASLSNVSHYEYLPMKGVEIVKVIENELSQRYQGIMEGDNSVLTDSKILVLVLIGNNVVDAISSDSGAMSAYRNIIGKYKNLNICVILGDCENAPINFNASEILKRIKEQTRLLFFDELPLLKMIEIPFTTQKLFKKPITDGDGYFIMGSECTKIKTIEADSVEVV